MKLVSLPLDQLDFSLDFTPTKTFPPGLPLICGKDMKVISGFNIKSNPIVALILDQDSAQLLKTFWNPDEMAGFERLRFLRASGINQDMELLKWPLEFQLFCDSKQISLKNLKPLTFLVDWMPQICEAVVKLKPSSSQTRQMIDLLCDLKFQDIQWPSIDHLTDAESWLNDLQKIRNPLKSKADQKAETEIMKLSWPKGVSARWEKHGDQAGVSIQARVYSNQEWLKIRDQLGNLNISEETWKI